MTKRQRGFKKPKQKFFYKADIFLSRIASVLKLPQSKVKELLFQSNLYAVKFVKPNVVKSFNDFHFKSVEWSKDTYLVSREEVVKLKKTREYSMGSFYIQNLAEMMPALVLKPKANEKILDMYSGYNTLDIALSMKGQGEIIANTDINPQKVGEILGKYRVDNATLLVGKGEDLGKKYPEYFDRVLLNAPCSREGIVHFAQKRPLKNWSIQKTKALSKLQKKLISTAFQCLKKGGVLVYSTATISPNENEEVVSHLLNENQNAFLENIDLIESKGFQDYKTFVSKGLKSWNNESYHTDIVKTIRTVPGKTMFGTYIALIRKA